MTATVVPEGTTLGLNGGGDLPGGVYVNFPPTASGLAGARERLAEQRSARAM